MKYRQLLYLVVILAVSCNTLDICDDDGESVLVARFKFQEPDDELASDSIVTGFTLYGIREGKADSLLYDSSTTSRIVLPLDPHHNFSRFVMSINDLSDTLTIGHATGYYLMSYTCGYAALFTLDPDSIIHGGTLFRDFEIINAVIDAEQEQNEEHLWLYF